MLFKVLKSKNQICYLCPVHDKVLSIFYVVYKLSLKVRPVDPWGSQDFFKGSSGQKFYSTITWLFHRTDIYTLTLQSNSGWNCSHPNANQGGYIFLF